MKVKELIAMLATMDPDHMVVVDGYEGGIKELFSARSVNIALNENDADSFFGPHEIVTYSCECEGKERVPAVYLPRISL